MFKKIYIIDLFSFIFRAFYAIRPLTAPDGTPVNAVYGVVSMVKKLMDSKKPDEVIVCMEGKEKPTFRKEMYPEYKANRGAPPEDLIPQIPLIEEFIRTYPLAVLSVPGFEADDLIASLVKHYRQDPQNEIYIVSSDKDLMQLLDDHVFLYDTLKEQVHGVDAAKEKFGVPPEKVVDVQALCGDSVDNIPGVSGVGPKTAAKLIQEYGSLDAVLENAAKIPGKLGERLRADRDKALLSRALASLKSDVPVSDHPDFHPQPAREGALHAFYARLGFKTLMRELQNTALPHFDLAVSVPDSQKKEESPISTPHAGKFFTIATQHELEEKIREATASKSILAFDTETDSLAPLTANLVGISLCWDKENSYYIPIAHHEGCNLPLEDVKKILNPLFSNHEIRKVAQNAKYDCHVLTRHGFELRSVSDDTVIMAYLLNPETAHNLDALAKRYLGHTMIAFESIVPRGKTFADVSIEKATEYSAEDAWAVANLYPLLQEKLQHDGFNEVYQNVEIPLVQILLKMERDGIRIDQEFLEKLFHEFAERLSHLQKKIWELAGEEFNVNSTKQLGVILFEKLGLPARKKTKTGYSTDVDVLSDLATLHDLPKCLLEFRTLTKLQSTYVIGLKNILNPQTGRVHTTFNQHVVATGRLSSTDPNLQNIPIKTPEGRRIRELFIADPGHVLLSADYSQIELRLLAAFSQDPSLVETYQNNRDVHALTASRIFSMPIEAVNSEQRSIGKTVNFGVLYGQSAFSLAQMLGIPRGEAQRFIDTFFGQFGHVRDYREKTLREAKQKGFVTTLLGRRRYTPDISSQNMNIRQNAERMAFNAVFQGSAADLIKKAMVDIDKALREENKKTKLLLQVHDELVLEVPLNEATWALAKIPELMQKAISLSVPLQVSCKTGNTWGEAH